MGFLSTLFACLLVVTAAACNSPTPAPTQQSPTATPSGSTATPTPLFLEVLEPADESVVSTARVAVRGRTTVDAVVTVNGETADVQADGSFQSAVTLQEGPNTIDVIASDFQGNEETAVLALIYIP